MKKVKEPEIFLVGITKMVSSGIKDYLNSINNPNWKPDENVSDGENLIEMAGRMCYRSWQAYDENKKDATNKNVKRVRHGNKNYINNIIKSGHGSIFEHVNMSFIIKNLSRIASHELVRHRAGMAYSQESLRYVRLDELNFWIPDLLKYKSEDYICDIVNYLEQVQRTLQDEYQIDAIDDFNTKKALTSAFRRLAPMGLGTSIFVTGNIRAWRHIIEIRSSVHAEEEIRLIARKIGHICKKEFPHLFQDMELNENNEWVFEKRKI